MQHKYLFYKENNRIKIYHFRDQQLELVRYKGNDSSSIDRAEFWEWWEKTSSYIHGQDTIDFCFLSDDNSYFLESQYEPVVESSWILEDIKLFIQENVRVSKIKLAQEGLENQEIILRQENERNPVKQVDLTIFTVPSTELFAGIDSNITITDSEVQEDKLNDEIDLNKESVLSIYYREKTKSYQ